MSLLLTSLLVAFLLDYLFGEPRKWHPLAGFGTWARRVEQAFYPEDERLPPIKVFMGALAWSMAVAAPLCLLALIGNSVPEVLAYVLVPLFLYFCIAPKSLEQHALAVHQALGQNDLDAAREACAKMVSRDTGAMNQAQVSAATVESVLENANDAVVAPVVWFVLAGLPGAILFRLSNTLDAMWGYRSKKYVYFGRFAARVDDVLGYLPARVTVFLYALQDWKALSTASRDGQKWSSPNAGPVMAAGARSLSIRLGGPARYHGIEEQRPWLGEGRDPAAEDIVAAIALTRRAYLALLALAVTALLLLKAMFS